MVRLFVAIALPDDIRARLAMLYGGVPGARWVEQENLHLTLRFIGEVGYGVAEDIDSALTTLKAPAFDLTLSGVGHFGNERAARLLWVGVERSEPLLHLHAKVEQALVHAGLPREERKFSPHVTLARLKGAKRVGDFIGANATFRSRAFPVERFVLYSSFLSASGAIYTPEAEYPLST